jgi:hypothetical protein
MRLFSETTAIRRRIRSEIGNNEKAVPQVFLTTATRTAGVLKEISAADPKTGQLIQNQGSGSPQQRTNNKIR